MIDSYRSGARIDGVYVLTDAAIGDADALARFAEAVIAGGASVIQYRDKGRDSARRRREAEAVLRACRSGCALCIINDDIELAAAIGADGVHLGKDDASLSEARRRLGPDAVIGVSCYDDLARAQAAAARGADYVAFGAFYPSATKPDARRAEPALLRAAQRQLDVPRVAIGGINADNAAPLIAAGADAVAVVGAVVQASDPVAATQAIAQAVADARRAGNPNF